MMLIKRSDKDIEMVGHAKDKISCAMMTALSVSLLENITQRMNESPKYDIKEGHFYLYTDDLTMDAMTLVDSFWYSVKSLSRSYPDSFKVSG